MLFLNHALYLSLILFNDRKNMFVLLKHWRCFLLEIQIYSHHITMLIWFYGELFDTDFPWIDSFYNINRIHLRDFYYVPREVRVWFFFACSINFQLFQNWRNEWLCHVSVDEKFMQLYSMSRNTLDDKKKNCNVLI